MKTLFRWFKRLFVLALLLALVGLVVGALAYQRYIIEEPGEHISRESIQKIIAQESPVLYRDGETRLGVLFAEEHREYVPYAKIPRAWVDAIVAAEDDRFWQHPGIDPKGVLRAFVKNVKAGRVVAGGSTLTQQTAKNLYYRPDRSWQSKLDEAANALRLERHYSKEEILEFYANQFHVSSNGRGLGIAARYFFNKDVSELTVLECAFLAGMVQAPARFNPFSGSTEAAQEAARQRAAARTRYVLGRMRATGSLDQASYEALVTQPIPFQKGAFRYDSSALLDAVAGRLEEAPFPEIFADLGIDNPSTAGIQIVTTLDVAAQREASYALSHHLTDVGMFLEKTELAGLVLPASRAPARDPDNPPAVHELSTARVRTSTADGLVLDLGGTACVVDKDGVKRMADLLARAASGDPNRASNAEGRSALLASLSVGDVVLASVREAGACDLEFQPQLQGAVLLLESGQIRAMVTGSDNRDFNRALDAKRQLGSTWKPLVYFAGLQLGWAPTDALDNRENAFPFQTTWYYPRPDHRSTETVSLSMAGTRSENLASIWLLYHLTDRLEPDQFRQVAELVGLTPRDGESNDAWIKRIRDDKGVLSTKERREELAFYGAKMDVLSAGLAHREDALNLRSLLYGRGAEGEEARVSKAASGADRDRMLSAVRANFLRLERQGEACAEAITSLRAGGSARGLYSRADLSGALACGKPGEGWVAAGLDSADRAPRPEDLLIDGRVHLGTLREVRRAMTRRALVLEDASMYDFDVLALHPDFRLLVNMEYVSKLATRLGVYEPLPPVLSMPLGAVDVRLEEAVSMYQAMRDGQVWRFPGTVSVPSAVPGMRSSDPVPSPARPTQLIAEVRDRDGNVLYRAKPLPEPVVDPAAARQVDDVLRNVVRWGTGRRALGAVTLEGAPVPVAGKTGTTNSYKNAAFLGFVPVLTSGVWRVDSAFTLGVYVGYDDNRPMRRGSTRIQGASGALPVWIGTAQGLADHGLLGAGSPRDSEWERETGMVMVPISSSDGMPLGGPAPDPLLTDLGASPSALVVDDGLEPDGGVRPARRFAPFAAENRPLARPRAAAAGRVEAASPEPSAAPADGDVDPALGLPPDDELIDTGIVPRLAPVEDAPISEPDAPPAEGEEGDGEGSPG